jgi:hypothetical protein
MATGIVVRITCQCVRGPRGKETSSLNQVDEVVGHKLCPAPDLVVVLDPQPPAVMTFIVCNFDQTAELALLYGAFILRKQGCEGAVCRLLWWRSYRRITPIVLGLRHLSLAAPSVWPQREGRLGTRRPWSARCAVENDRLLIRCPPKHRMLLISQKGSRSAPPGQRAKQKGSVSLPMAP